MIRLEIKKSDRKNPFTDFLSPLFLKTGTLTEGGLEFCGVAPRSKDENVFIDLVRDPALQYKQDDPVLITLAACHTLTRIEGFYHLYFL